MYSFTAIWSGNRYVRGCDQMINHCLGVGYDDFSNMNYRNTTQGTPANDAWSYDRWGNRSSQTPQDGGFTDTLSFNTTTNQVNSAGFSYDAAGNVRTDGYHSYTYDRRR